MRRNQPRPARHLAVATALLAGLALAGCAQPDEATPGLSPGSSQSTTTASPSTTSAATQAGGSTSPSETAGPTTHGAAAEQAVRAWLQAARDGDLAKLESGLGTYSKEQAKKLGGLEGMESGLAEGISAFLDTKTWAVHPIPGHDNTWLVVASGEVTREGMTETDARAWLVHPEGGGKLVVETFATPVPQVVAPAPGQKLDAAKPVIVDLPAGDVVAFVDNKDAGTHVSTEPATGAGTRVTVQPPTGGWPAGQHVVAVAAVPKDGQTSPWASVAAAFTVE